MSSKRQATTDLNHDNWDVVEDPEERGTFRTAPENELKTRTIRKAARRVKPNMTSESNEETKKLFSGFAGFQKTNTATFSFLDKITPKDAETSFKKSLHGETVPKKLSENSTQKNDDSEPEKSVALSKLKTLNMAVSSWIRTHIDQNPICILTPVFDDYKKYLNELELHNITIDATDTKNIFGIQTSKSNDIAPNKPKTLMDSNLPNLSTSSNISGMLSSDKSTSSDKQKNIFSEFRSGFVEGSGNLTASSGFGVNNFSMGRNNVTSKGITFNSISTSEHCEPSKNSNTTPDPEEKSDDENELPKISFKQVVEENAIYSHKCKAFIKKNNEFVDCGVGTLYLKPVNNGEKMQLLMRADTTLGNIQANFLLSSATPIKRLGKNNVMIMCLPTPDYTKPTALLLRVKTSEEADELMDTIIKHQK